MGMVFLNSFGEFIYYFAFLVFIFNICESESHTNSSSLSPPLNRNCAEVRINPKMVEQTDELTPFVQCADTSYSYYEATQDCTGYVYCMAGGDIDGPYDCGVDMLYDTDTQRCMWADQVTSCSGSGGGVESSPGVPTLMPTPKPTQKNSLLDWEKIPRHHDKVIIGYCKFVFG
jgi:hypothetical protein